MEFLHNFSFVIKHTSGKSNKVHEDLSRVNLILHVIKVSIFGFQNLVNMYKEDMDFKDVYASSENPVSHNRSQWLEYMVQEGLSFKSNKLCIPKCFMRENMIQEKHSGGLSGNFGHDKKFSHVSAFIFG